MDEEVWRLYTLSGWDITGGANLLKISPFFNIHHVFLIGSYHSMMDLVACAVALADLCVLVILCAWKLFTITLWMLVFSHKNIRKEKKLVASQTLVGEWKLLV